MNMEAKSNEEIYDISDAGLVSTSGGMTDLQVAAAAGLGSFLDEVGSGLSSRYLTGLVDKGFDDVRSLAVGEEKLIEYGDVLPGHAIKISQAAIEVTRGSPGSVAIVSDVPAPGEVESRRLAGPPPSFPSDITPSRSKVESWWAQFTAWSRVWSENVANYLVELGVDVSKTKTIYERFPFTQEQNNFAGNKLMQAFEKSEHVMSLYSRQQKNKPTMMTLMTVIALTHFPQDEEYKTRVRNKFNDFPSCKDRSKLLGQYNLWCDLLDELKQLGQKVAEDDEAIMASFKRLIVNIDEIQQVIGMSKKLLGK